MVTIEIYRENFNKANGEPYPIFYLDFYDKLNIIMGDSGSGKTYFFNTLLEALNGVDPWKCTCYKNFDKNNKFDDKYLFLEMIK